MSRVWFLVLACVGVPPLWGLAVEWAFRTWRGDRHSRYLGDGPPPERKDG